MGTDGNITKDKATANINAAESQETSFIRIKDQLIEKARGFNLLKLDHARRTRFYAAMIDSECLEKGKDYHEMPDVHMIYISETDLWAAGKTLYKVEKKFEGTQIPYDDGVYVTYVNAEIDDGSDVAKLMDYFKTADPEDMSQGELSARIHFLKCEEGGYPEMCEVSEKIYNEGIIEGKKEGIIEGKKETAFNMKNKGYSDAVIADILDVGINVIQQWLSGGIVKS